MYEQAGNQGKQDYNPGSKPTTGRAHSGSAALAQERSLCADRVLNDMLNKSLLSLNKEDEG